MNQGVQYQEHYINHVLKVRLLFGSSGEGHHGTMCRMVNGSSWCHLRFVCFVPLPFMFVASQSRLFNLISSSKAMLPYKEGGT